MTDVVSICVQSTLESGDGYSTLELDSTFDVAQVDSSIKSAATVVPTVVGPGTSTYYTSRGHRC